MADWTKIGNAMQLVGMGMQGNSAGISDYFSNQEKAKAEQAKQEQIQAILQSLQGQGAGDMENYASKLGQLAQIDGRFLPTALEAMSPAARADYQLNQITLENARAEQQQKQALESKRRTVLGGGFVPPAVGSAIGQLSQADQRMPVPPPMAPSAFEQLAGMPETGVDANQAMRDGTLIDLIRPFANGGMGQPVQPVMQEPSAAPQMASAPTGVQSNGVSFPTFQEWASTPKGQAASALGDEKALERYLDDADAFKTRQVTLSDEAAKSAEADAAGREKALMTLQTSQPVFDNITSMADALLQNQAGLNRITGTASMLPFSVLPESREAQANLDSIKENLSTERLQQIRASGFAPGSITEKEWPRFENALVNLKAAQRPETVRSALVKLKDVMVDIQNIQRKAAGLEPLPKPSETPKQPTRRRYNPETGSLE
jgi:hypothetical protein